MFNSIMLYDILSKLMIKVKIYNLMQFFTNSNKFKYI
jgi:hypothetical protein